VRDANGNQVTMSNNVPPTPIPATGSPELGAAVSIPAGASWNPAGLTPWDEPKEVVTVELLDEFGSPEGAASREPQSVD
jgi:hypothetical protein